MISNLFWTVATSYFAFGIDGGILLIAAAVGFLPLVKYLPVVGPYVPAAKLVAVLVALLMAFLVGFRISDKRDELKNLRATIAIQKADLENAAKSAADAQTRVTQIEANASAQHQTDADYIASLQARPACALTDDDISRGRRVRARSAAGSGSRSPAGP